MSIRGRGRGSLKKPRFGRGRGRGLGRSIDRGNEPNGLTVQPTQLIFISIEAEFCALQSYREFFSNFILVFEL